MNNGSAVDAEADGDAADSGTGSDVLEGPGRETDQPALSTTQLGVILFGSVVVASGVVFVVVPGLAPTLDVTVVLEMLMALLAIGAGLAFGINYLRRGAAEADPPLVEYRSTVSVPGESIDVDLFTQTGDGPLGLYKQLNVVRDQLRTLLDRTLTRTGIAEADLAETVSSGRWTDDDIAAGFFASRSPFSTARRVRMRVTRQHPLQVQARHAIDAIARRLSLTDREWADPAASGDVSSIEAGWVGRLSAVERGVSATNRWRVVAGLTALSVGTGVLLNSGVLVLTGAVGFGPLAFRYLGSAPSPRLRVERELDRTDPDPGESVTVTVTVTNAGDGMVFDLRYVDGVPPGLSVLSGSPRHGTTLRPGASARFAYVVEAERGEHTFEESLAIVRDASGGIERSAGVAAGGEQFLRCEPKPTSELTVPVRSKTSRDVGRVVTDTGGSGLEFHSVREYRPGDPLGRIDWNRLARGGDLATMQFSEEHAATVVLLLDARAEAFVAPERESPSAMERSLEAAAEVFRSRLQRDDRVGLAALAADDCWLAPGAGHGHWTLARRLLTTDTAFTETGAASDFYPMLAMRELRTRLPSNAQLVLFSPLCDETAVWMARKLHAYGYSMTVVSPDATTTASPGRTVAHMERLLRLSRLRQADVRVIDWGREESLDAAVDRATRRWSR